MDDHEHFYLDHIQNRLFKKWWRYIVIIKAFESSLDLIQYIKSFRDIE